MLPCPFVERGLLTHWQANFKDIFNKGQTENKLFKWTTQWNPSLICRNEDGHQSAEDASPWDRRHVYTAEAGCPTHVRGAEKGA